jgi:hypothetical protein
MEERFWAKVDKSGDCWLWTGSVAGDYGRLSITCSSRRIPAHRYSYMLHFGPFDERLFVCHRCDTPRCVRPDHLFLGDARDNAVDMSLKSRGRGQAKSHCPSGHPYDDENTYYPPSRPNSRVCKACHRQSLVGRFDAAYWREYRAARKAQGRPVKGRK